MFRQQCITWQADEIVSSNHSAAVKVKARCITDTAQFLQTNHRHLDNNKKWALGFIIPAQTRHDRLVFVYKTFSCSFCCDLLSI